MRFFRVEILTEICRRLVGHYFLLTQEELQIWDSDPEEFSMTIIRLYKLFMGYHISLSVENV